MHKIDRHGAATTRAHAYLRALDDQRIAARYRQAVLRLATITFLSRVFEDAADIAINVCENARSGKPRVVVDQNTKIARDLYRTAILDRKKWNSMSTAALKFGKALTATKIGFLRLASASNSIKMGLTPQQTRMLPQLLDALNQQQPGNFGRLNFVVRPILVTTPTRKRMSLSNALTIGLAHVFDQLSKGETRIICGVTITGGAAWDVAADFSQAATGETEDASPAKKALSEHKGYLNFIC